MKEPDLFDGDALTVEAQDIPEADIQAKCIQSARRCGAYARKFASPANRSVPDYVITLNGVTWYVEFKRRGKLPTEAQAEEHEAIRAAGGTVWIIDDVFGFKVRLGRFITTGVL